VVETSTPLCGILQKGFIIAALPGSVSTATTPLSSFYRGSIVPSGIALIRRRKLKVAIEL